MSEKKKKSSTDYSLWAQRVLKASGDEATSKPEGFLSENNELRKPLSPRMQGSRSSLDSGLYVVATPIGNLGDITLRALHTLATADVVACEDTRITGALLHRFGIKKPLLAYHDHNADERRTEILKRLAAGEAVALVSDAGTPLISDPGYKLVRACRAAGYDVIALPGASALLTALCAAGLPTDKFMFAGFLPNKSTARQKALKELAALPSTLVFYEAPARLEATLGDMAKVLGGARKAAVARELTKLFEEIREGTLAVLAAQYRDEATPKGEIVIVVGPPEEAAVGEADIDGLLRKALKTMSVRDAVSAVAEATGAKKGDVYKKALVLDRSSDQKR